MDIQQTKVHITTTTLLRMTVLWAIVCLLISGQCFAQSPQQALHQQELASISQQLSVEKQRTQVAQTKLDDLQKRFKQHTAQAKVEVINQQILERGHLNLAVAKADVLATSQSIQAIKQKLLTINNAIQQADERLQEARVLAVDRKQEKARVAIIKSEIEYLKSLQAIQNVRLAELNETMKVVQGILKLEQAWLDRYTRLYQKQQNQLREKALEKLMAKSQQQRKQLLTQLKNLNQRLQTYTAEQRYSEPKAILLAVTIFQTEERINLSRINVELARLQEHVEDLTLSPDLLLPIPEVDKLLSSSNRLLLQIEPLASQLGAKQDLIKNHIEISEKTQEQGLINKGQLKQQLALLTPLLKQYAGYTKQINNLQQRVEEYKAALQKSLTEAIARRQGLPGFDMESWMAFVNSLSHMPKVALSAMRALKDQVILSLSLMHWLWFVILTFLGMLWFGIWILCRRYITLAIDAVEDNRQRVSANVAFVLLQLLKRNLVSMMLIGFGLLLLVLIGVPYKSYRFLFYIILIGYAYRFIIGLARLSLLETMSNVSGHDVRLYHRLKWVFGLGGLITALTVLSHQLHVAYEVRDLFNRLFMLFLMILSLVLFKGRKVVPSLLNTYVEHGRPYLRRAISLMSTLIPLTLLSNALIGLLGYIQLAWVMSYYQIVFLLVLTTYVIARGLLVDLLDLISHLSIQYLQNGWLWSQALLKPLDRIVRIAVAVGAVVVLFLSYGWGAESVVVTKLYNFIRLPIYMFPAGSQITLLSITEFIILLAIVLWAARWTREFTYRWWYRGVHDLGLRKSLSIFSQYLIVIIGVWITLRVLGLDISGLFFILGGLAVGLGFGLRDFANNIVCGVMLLIERPVREGDLVSVGIHEGQVTHIGLRAMMIKSWDNMEVLVPNSEAINKVMINWTHQDSVVRTIIAIKVHRLDDPKMIEGLIANVLSEMPSVLTEPAPQILLKEIDDVLIEFQVRYFLNLQDHSRVAVRSEVLFALNKTFNEHGVRSPYPQQDVRFLNKN